jgi:hypothetical protein
VACRNLRDGPRIWRDPEAIHIDVRGLEPPEPMVEILRLLDGGEADAVVVAHLDREPIFLYPELESRGWAYEIIPSACADVIRADEVMLRIVRLGV